MDTKNPKFYNKNGDLSMYAFSCGYIQQYNNENGTVKLYREHCAWHIRLFDSNGKRLEWIVHNRLATARKQYAIFKTLIKNDTIEDFKSRII